MGSRISVQAKQKQLDEGIMANNPVIVAKLISELHDEKNKYPIAPIASIVGKRMLEFTKVYNKLTPFIRVKCISLLRNQVSLRTEVLPDPENSFTCLELIHTVLTGHPDNLLLFTPKYFDQLLRYNNEKEMAQTSVIWTIVEKALLPLDIEKTDNDTIRGYVNAIYNSPSKNILFHQLTGLMIKWLLTSIEKMIFLLENDHWFGIHLEIALSSKTFLKTTQYDMIKFFICNPHAPIGVLRVAKEQLNDLIQFVQGNAKDDSEKSLVLKKLNQLHLSDL